MIVIPKPPVEVNSPAGYGKAVAYLHDMAVVQRTDGALYIFPNDKLTPLDQDKSPPTPSNIDAAAGPAIRRGHLVAFKPYDPDAAQYRVTAVANNLVSLVSLQSDYQTTAYLHEVMLVPFQDAAQKVAAMAGSVLKAAKGTGAVQKGYRALYEGDVVVVSWLMGDQATVYKEGDALQTRITVPAAKLTPYREAVPVSNAKSPAPPLICPGHTLGEDDRCTTCGLSKKAIVHANESYTYTETRGVTATSKPRSASPLWLERVRQLIGEPGTKVQIVVQDQTGVPLLTEAVDPNSL